MRPASPGTGVIAGGSVRVIMELAGVKNILTKILKSKNSITVARATMNGLQKLLQSRILRQQERQDQGGIMAVKKKTEYPKIKIKLIKSLIGRSDRQQATVKGLGLRKINSEVIREKRPEILGMIRKIEFMLQVEEVGNDQSK